MKVKGLIRFLRQRPLLLLALKVFRVWRRGGFVGLRWRQRLLSHQTTGYAEWLLVEEEQLSVEHEALINKINCIQNPPLISIIMPVCDSEEVWLQRAIDSVQRQIYSNWQLCIADDSSTSRHVKQLLMAAESSDERICVNFRQSRGHICAATKSALELANGEFVTFLDHDDELSPYALAMVAIEISQHPEVDLLYSDEDLIGTDGCRYDPYFKPDWNPELLLAQNYICHMSVYRADLLDEIDAFHPDVQGSQDWDLALRASERAQCIRHIPYILYHWRSLSGSVAYSDRAKDYALHTGCRAVNGHLTRQGEEAEAILLEFGHLRVNRKSQVPMPAVSLIIVTDSKNAISRHLETVEQSIFHSFEMIFITTRLYPELELPEDCSLIIADENASMAHKLNCGARSAKGEILCFVYDGCEEIDSLKLKLLVLEAMRPEIGAVGARLLSHDGLIYHAGYLLDPDMVVLHPYHGAPAKFAGIRNRNLLQQNVSAVSGFCMAVKRDIFIQCAGFYQASGRFYDVDFCIRLLEKGLQNIWTPHVSLRILDLNIDNLEADIRMDTEAIQYMRSQWYNYLVHDTSGNPNLVIDNGLPVPNVKR